MGARYILNSDHKTQGTNMDLQPPSDHAPSKACETTKLWAKFQAPQATMGSLKGHNKINKIKDQETFQSSGMPDCNHCNES
jgi:hypothetical protein